RVVGRDPVVGAGGTRGEVFRGEFGRFVEVDRGLAAGEECGAGAGGRVLVGLEGERPVGGRGAVGEGVGDGGGVVDRFAQLDCGDSGVRHLGEVPAGAAVDVEGVGLDRVVAVGEHVQGIGAGGHLELVVAD